MASNGGSWWPPVVVSGGEEGVRFGWAFREEESKKIKFFTLNNIFIICNLA